MLHLLYVVHDIVHIKCRLAIYLYLCTINIYIYILYIIYIYIYIRISKISLAMAVQEDLAPSGHAAQLLQQLGAAPGALKSEFGFLAFLAFEAKKVMPGEVWFWVPLENFSSHEDDPLSLIMYPPECWASG